MKANKASKVSPVSNVASSGKKLSIVFDAKLLNLETFKSLIEKSKDVQWIAYGNNARLNSEPLADPSRLTLTSGTIQQAAEIAENDWVLPLFDSPVFSIAEIQQKLASEKRLGEHQIWSAVRNKSQDETQKVTGLPSILLAKFRFLSGLLSPVKQRDAALETAVFQKEVFAELCHERSVHSNFELLWLARLAGISIGALEASINAESLKSSKLISGLIRLLGLTFSMRLFWFYTVPLQALRGRASTLLVPEKSWFDPGYPAYRMLFASLFILFLFGMPYLSFDYGITWDERIQRDYGRDIYKYLSTLGEDQSVFDMSKAMYDNMIYYGSFFDTFTTFVNENFPLFGEYETRHFFNALLGFLAMVLVGIVTKEIAGWRAGLIAFVFMLISPHFFGHSMNNPKDIPFAFGFIASFLCILRVVKEMPQPSLATMTLAILSLWFTNSIRIGGLLLFGYLGLFLLVKWIGIVRSQSLADGLKLIWPYAKVVLIIFVISYIMVLAVWPYGQQDPITNTFNALKGFSNVNYVVSYELFNGQKINMQQVPPYYSPLFMAITNPVPVVIGFLLGAAGILIISKEKRYASWMIWAVLFAYVFPLAYIAYKKSLLLNGWRHTIFVYLFAVILSSIFWDYLITRFRQKWIAVSLTILLLAYTGKTVEWMIRNHPNQYVYFNELIGGIDGAFGKFETDYYGNSMRAGVEWIFENYPEYKQKPALFTMTAETNCANYYTRKVNDSIVVTWSRDYEKYKQNWDFALISSRTMSKAQIENGLFPPKGTVHTIKVDNTPILAIVKRPNSFMQQGYAFMERSLFDSAALNFKSYLEFDSMCEEAWYQLGFCYLNLGNYEEAEQALQKSIRLYPENYISWNYLGYARQSKNDLNGAYDAFKKSTELRINYSSSWVNLGRLQGQMAKYAEALKTLEQAMNSTQGQSPEVYNEIAKVLIMQGMSNNYMRQGNMNSALQYLGRAIELYPNYGEAYRNMAYAYSQLGNNTMAEQALQRARQLGVQ